MLFSILGDSYDIDHDSIIHVANGNDPGYFDGRHKYYVRIEGQRYPIKQLLAGATGLDKIQFTAQYAHRILTKLGFLVEELRPAFPRRQIKPHRSLQRPSDDAAAGGLEEDDRVRLYMGGPDRAESLRFAVALERDEDGFIVASCPSLPGCHSQGLTRQEALSNVAEAIRGYVASMRKHQDDIPNVDWEVVEVAV